MKNFISTDEINRMFSSKPYEAASHADENFRKQLSELAEKIRPRVKDCPIILISGPSGSGKTTTAKMLEDIFDRSGLETHTIPLDNYFRTIPKEDHVHIQSGRIDLESPDRLDTELLSDHLERITRCEPVELPVYDFPNTTQKRSGIILKRKPDEPVILEGIHALNPDAVRIPEGRSCGIYVSVQTHVACGEISVHPLHIRLMRRMLRDVLHRGRSVIQTAEMLPEVERGKLQFIKPYRKYADFEIDTFFPYEPGVYKTLLMPELQNALEDKRLSSESAEAIRNVLRLLSGMSPLSPEIVADNALIREFMGER